MIEAGSTPGRREGVRRVPGGTGDCAPRASRLRPAFGEVISETGTWPDEVPFGYQSNWLYLTDTPEGHPLYLPPARAPYHAGIGRFLQRDPLQRPGENAYVYAANNPVNVVDPAGEQAPKCPKDMTDEELVAESGKLRDEIDKDHTSDKARDAAAMLAKINAEIGKRVGTSGQREPSFMEMLLAITAEQNQKAIDKVAPGEPAQPVPPVKPPEPPEPGVPPPGEPLPEILRKRLLPRGADTPPPGSIPSGLGPEKDDETDSLVDSFLQVKELEEELARVYGQRGRAYEQVREAREKLERELASRGITFSAFFAELARREKESAKKAEFDETTRRLEREVREEVWRAKTLERLFWLRVAGEIALFGSGSSGGTAARAPQIAGRGGHHAVVASRHVRAIGRIPVVGGMAARLVKVFSESSANVIYKGATLKQQRAWHALVDPFVHGGRGWKAADVGVTLAMKRSIRWAPARLCLGAPHWLQRTVQGLGAAYAPEVLPREEPGP